jgi:uncharacterized spore protein YtfJ
VYRKLSIAAVAALVLCAVASAQKPAEKKAPAAAVAPASLLADELARSLGENLHVKTIVGQPVKAGAITIIPILSLDLSFGGGGVAAPGNAPGGFFMNGEARPIGFVVVTPKGTHFITVANPAAQ